MSAMFKRNAKAVDGISINDVERYLDLALQKYDSVTRDAFETLLRPNDSEIMAVYKGDVVFGISIDNTWIELNFEEKHREKMQEVVKTMTEWDKFSKKPHPFYVEIVKEGQTYIFFEIGGASIGDYSRRFKDEELKVTTF